MSHKRLQGLESPRRKFYAEVQRRGQISQLYMFCKQSERDSFVQVLQSKGVKASKVSGNQVLEKYKPVISEGCMQLTDVVDMTTVGLSNKGYSQGDIVKLAPEYCSAEESNNLYEVVKADNIIRRYEIRCINPNGENLDIELVWYYMLRATGLKVTDLSNS